MHLLNHLDQSVTGGHDWETFLSTAIVEVCMAIEIVLRCVPQFIPSTFTLMEQSPGIDIQAFWCSFQSDSCVLQVVE